MSLLDTLRKLGIIRFGTKSGTYRNATERPTEFLMDDVGNAEKEVINLNALDKPAPAQPAPVPPVINAQPVAANACAKCGGALKPDAKFCGSCGAPVAGVPPAAAATASPPKSSSKMKGCLIGGLIGFALLVVLLVVLALIGSQTEQPKQTGDSKPAPPPVPPASATVKETPAPVLTPPPATVPAPVQTPEPSVNDRFKPGAPAAPPAMPTLPPATPSTDYVPGVAAATPAPAPGAVKYDRYANPKFGFVTELPAHWESQVRDNSHVFSGPKGAEDCNTTVNFQFITMTAGNSLPQQRRAVIDQWKRMQDYRLVEDETQNFQNRYTTVYLHAGYKLPGNDTLWEQIQVIIERQPYYYFIGYTSPQPLFEKYYPHLKHLIQTLQFTPLPQ